MTPWTGIERTPLTDLSMIIENVKKDDLQVVFFRFNGKDMVLRCALAILPLGIQSAKVKSYDAFSALR